MGREGRDYWEAQLSEYWDSGLTIQEYSELKELPYEMIPLLDIQPFLMRSVVILSTRANPRLSFSKAPTMAIPPVAIISSLLWVILNRVAIHFTRRVEFIHVSNHIHNILRLNIFFFYFIVDFTNYFTDSGKSDLPCKDYSSADLFLQDQQRQSAAHRDFSGNGNSYDVFPQCLLSRSEKQKNWVRLKKWHNMIWNTSF